MNWKYLITFKVNIFWGGYFSQTTIHSYINELHTCRNFLIVDTFRKYDLFPPICQNFGPEFPPTNWERGQYLITSGKLSHSMLSFDSWSISGWTLLPFPVLKQDILKPYCSFFVPPAQTGHRYGDLGGGKGDLLFITVVITEFYKWSRPSYTVLHCTKAAITLISPPILVIVQDSGIWYKAQVEGRIQALILVDVQIGAHSDPLTGNMATWRKTLTCCSAQASCTSAHKLSLKKIVKFSVDFTSTSFSMWWASAIYHGGQVGWN